MAQERISGEEIYYAFVAGKNRVTNFREELNNINVFPVNDSDTGNNLSSTLTYIAETVELDISPEEMVRQIADASLSGARGNSGIIFAQFINGLYEELNGKDFEKVILSDVIAGAVPYAYKAVSRPAEGTMLTVIKDWAEALKKVNIKEKDFKDYFNEGLAEAKISLEKTPEKLKVLRDANVVDAGAQGFVHFLEGISDYIAGIAVTIKENISDAYKHVEEISMDEDITHRYCCEALIIGKDMAIDEIRKTLEPMGVSLIVAGNKEKVKVHIHSNNPPQIFIRLREFGKITQQKVDDMQMEHDVNSNRKHPIALVTDSIADLPKEFIDENQIHVFPLNIDIEGSTFLDKAGMNNEILFSIIDDLKTFPTSSQPSLKFVKQKLSYLKEKYESIIVISVSAELSGTWNVFNTVVKELTEDGYEISLIDSCLNSGAQGLLVMEAQELINKNLTHREIVEEIEKRKEKTKIYVSVSDFNFMVRGGRVSPLKGKVAKMLNFKPIISLDEKGKGYSFANALSQKGNLKKIKDIVIKLNKTRQVKKYAIVHGQAPEKGEEYRKVFKELTGKEPEFIQEISSIVALSSGRGAVALCVMED